jgi:mannosidase alpha-like ER degradation enhancer 2
LSLQSRALQWQESVRALNKYLADGCSTDFWYGQLDMVTGKRTATKLGALHAFLPKIHPEAA